MQSLCICKNSVVKLKLSSKLTSTKDRLRKGLGGGVFVLFFQGNPFKMLALGGNHKHCLSLAAVLFLILSRPHRPPCWCSDRFLLSYPLILVHALSVVSLATPEVSFQESESFDLRSSFSCASS